MKCGGALRRKDLEVGSGDPRTPLGEKRRGSRLTRNTGGPLELDLRLSEKGAPRCALEGGGIASTSSPGQPI